MTRRLSAFKDTGEGEGGRETRAGREGEREGASRRKRREGETLGAKESSYIFLKESSNICLFSKPVDDEVVSRSVLAEN